MKTYTTTFTARELALLNAAVSLQEEAALESVLPSDKLRASEWTALQKKIDSRLQHAIVHEKLDHAHGNVRAVG